MCAVWASGVYIIGNELRGLSEAVEEGVSLVSKHITYTSMWSPSLSPRYAPGAVSQVLLLFVIFIPVRDPIIILVL